MPSGRRLPFPAESVRDGVCPASSSGFAGSRSPPAAAAAGSIHTATNKAPRTTTATTVLLVCIVPLLSRSLTQPSARIPAQRECQGRTTAGGTRKCLQQRGMKTSVDPDGSLWRGVGVSGKPNAACGKVVSLKNTSFDLYQLRSAPPRSGDGGSVYEEMTE